MMKDIKFLKIDVPVMYDDEIPEDFPCREKSKHGWDRWKIIVDVETGQIINFPKDIDYNFFAKPVDSGSYYLLDKNKNIIASIEDNYVPNKAIPDSDGYGDYINLNISKGYITNWYKSPNYEEFFK